MASPSPSTATLIGASRSTTTLVGGDSSQFWSPFIEDGKTEDDKDGKAEDDNDGPRQHRSYTSLVGAAPRHAGFFKAAPGQAWRDLRSASWGKCVLWGLYISWLVILAISLSFLGYIGSDDGKVMSNFACQPDGSFSVYAYRFNWWAPTSFFQVSISSGHFSFTEVKVLDIAVQLIVGRGGQALLAFISWRAFRNYLTAKMIESPVTFATFFVIFIQTEPTLVGTYRLIREFCLHRRPGSIAAGIFIPVTVIFLFIFPTFVNTTTGYITVSNPYIDGYDGDMIRFEDFDKVAYVIHDGDRIGETEDYVVPVYAHDALVYDNEENYSECYGKDPPEGCNALNAASEYVKNYGFYGRLDEETTWDEDVELDAPALNISGFYFPSNDPVYGFDWEDPEKEKENWDERFPFRNLNKMEFTTSSESTYDMEYIKENGRCQPSSEVYKWGASFIQLVIMALALLVWSLGVAIMWFSGHRCLPLAGEPEVVRGWRAVVQLARAMEAELPAAGVDLDTMTDDGAKREARKRLRGGAVSNKGHVLSRGEGGLRAAALAWLRKETWWAVACAACFAVGFFCYYELYRISFDVGYLLAVMSWSFTGLLVGVMALGTTLGSRLLMVLVGAVPILAVLLPMLVSYW